MTTGRELWVECTDLDACRGRVSTPHDAAASACGADRLSGNLVEVSDRGAHLRESSLGAIDGPRPLWLSAPETGLRLIAMQWISCATVRAPDPAPGRGVRGAIHRRGLRISARRARCVRRQAHRSREPAFSRPGHGPAMTRMLQVSYRNVLASGSRRPAIGRRSHAGWGRPRRRWCASQLSDRGE
jgi:hypothetical protein